MVSARADLLHFQSIFAACRGPDRTSPRTDFIRAPNVSIITDDCGLDIAMVSPADRVNLLLKTGSLADPASSLLRTKLENAMKIAIAILAASAGMLALAQTDANAAPNCNQAPYGNCIRCTGWASMPYWAAQACYHASNPQVTFACSSNKCGLPPSKLPKGDLKPRPRQGNGVIPHQENRR